MREVKVETQADLDAALRKGESRIVIVGADWLTVRGQRPGTVVEAMGSAHVVARESAHVVASKFVAVTKQLGHFGLITGGVVITIPAIETAEDWCAYHGVTVQDGVAVLYKAVRDNYRSAWGLLYAPGTQPEAPDWDGGRAECGGGLHFAAYPGAAKGFDPEATRFLACPVALTDLRAPRADDTMPSKIKARRVCGPIVEVDIFGKPVVAAEATA